MPQLRMPGQRRPAAALLASLALVVALTAAGLGGCGGGDVSSSPLPPLPGLTCSGAEQRLWLVDYFDDWYFWRRQAPDPSPFPDRSVAELFQASLYTGNDPQFPRDRWSRMESSADFDRFFTDGKSLGYGLFLAGLEIQGQPDRPLRVRYVEPRSDAAAQGVQRGEQIVSAGGRSAAQMVASDDFTPFTPSAEGQNLSLVLRQGTQERTLSLRATAFALTPVTLGQVLQTPAGRRMGYLHVKDMIDQAEPQLAKAFADFRAAGVQELAIDLRYNGGGLVSLANTLASYVSAARTHDRTFASLRFNDRRAGSNDTRYRFEDPALALGLTRVYLLTGPRTCSASELVINGLRPFVDVVVVGDTSCGKPVGFVPVSRCDTTFNVVNFEAVNADNQGRYFGGIEPRCAVEENLSQPLGAPDEPLLAAARQHADSGSCPATSGVLTARRRALRAADGQAVRAGEPPERQGMWTR